MPQPARGEGPVRNTQFTGTGSESWGSSQGRRCEGAPRAVGRGQLKRERDPPGGRARVTDTQGQRVQPPSAWMADEDKALLEDRPGRLSSSQGNRAPEPGHRTTPHVPGQRRRSQGCRTRRGGGAGRPGRPRESRAQTEQAGHRQALCPEALRGARRRSRRPGGPATAPQGQRPHLTSVRAREQRRRLRGLQATTHLPLNCSMTTSVKSPRSRSSEQQAKLSPQPQRSPQTQTAGAAGTQAATAMPVRLRGHCQLLQGPWVQRRLCGDWKRCEQTREAKDSRFGTFKRALS